MACVCCPLVFEFSVGIGGFVIGLSQSPSFLFTYSTDQYHVKNYRIDLLTQFNVQDSLSTR